MRILMVNKYLYPRAGAETYMLSVARELVDRGHEVAFFGMEHPDNPDFGMVRTIPWIEFGSHHGKVERMMGYGRRLAQGVTGVAHREMKALIRDFQPDLIHAHNVYNQIPPSLLLPFREQGIPTVMTVHDYQPVCPNYSLFVDNQPCERCLDGSFWNCVKHRCSHGSLFNSMLSSAAAYQEKRNDTYARSYDLFVAPSHHMKRMLVKGGFDPRRVEVVHNFSALPENYQEATGEGILYFGRLSKEKGIDTLIEAYAQLENPPPLTIAGDGPLRETLTAFARARGLTDIRWLGHISQEQLKEEFASHALVVVPSLWYENCSMAIMEALAHGRPVLASRRGGNPELVLPGINGDIFEAGDPKDLKAKLEPLVQNLSELKKMGARSREMVIEKFSPEVHLEQIIARFEGLIEQKVLTG